METAGKSLFPWKEICRGSTRSPQVRLEEAVVAAGRIFTQAGDLSSRVMGSASEFSTDLRWLWALWHWAWSCVWQGRLGPDPGCVWWASSAVTLQREGHGCSEQPGATVDVLRLWVSFSRIACGVHPGSSWSRGRAICHGQICSLYKTLPWEFSDSTFLSASPAAVHPTSGAGLLCLSAGPGGAERCSADPPRSLVLPDHSFQDPMAVCSPFLGL